MKKILIRADGGKGIGMGHVMRMLSLAKELKKYCGVTFICRSADDKFLTGIAKIKENGFKVIEISGSNLVDEIKEIQESEKADLLITDSYEVDDEYFDSLDGYFKKTAYVDDINICRINVDIIINQNINAFEHKYNTYPKASKFFLGPEYIMLRDEFVAPYKMDINEEVKNIFLTIGGMDDEYLSIKIIESLKNIDCTLHVIIGSAFEQNLVNKIEDFKSEHLKVISYKNAIMSEVMKKCDLAISACGSTIYELSVLGIPTIGIVVAENQKRVAEVMEDNQIIINTDKIIYNDAKLFSDIIRVMIKSKDVREKLSNNCRKVVNVKGSEELVTNLLQLI